jgi:hypothetical protein
VTHAICAKSTVSTCALSCTQSAVHSRTVPQSARRFTADAEWLFRSLQRVELQRKTATYLETKHRLWEY